jgi:transcription elongation factor/antiterminator RfaH
MNNASKPNLVGWYVIHTHRRQEDRVGDNLSVLGVETFIPRIKQRQYNKYTGNAIYLIRPFFSNYIFARFDAHTLLHKVRLTRGVHSLVCYGVTPARVDDWVITTIQSRTGEDGCVKIGERFSPGDMVVIEDGPLKEFRGIFERETRDADRVMILLQTVSYQAHLVIEREMLKKAS